MPHEREPTITNQAPDEMDVVDKVELLDEVELTDEVGLASKKIRIRADMSGRKGPPFPTIEFSVSGTVFKRAKEVLKDKELTPIKVGGVIVFGVAAAAVGVLAAKKIIEKRQEKKRLEKEAQIPLLTEEQEENFIAMYDSYHRRIFGYVYQRVGNVKETQDLTHDVFFRALRAFPRFIPNPDLENPHLSWLYRITRNRLANYWRDKRTEVAEDILTTLFSDESEEPPEEMEMLRQVYNSLSDLDKLVIWLKLVEKLPNKDIAYILHKSEGAVKSLYYRILYEKIGPRVLQEVERKRNK